MHSQLGGMRNVPRIVATLRAGKAILADWQGLVRVSVIPELEFREPRGLIIGTTPKFTFHTAILRDKLGELCMGGDVDIVKKASALCTGLSRVN
jgi:DNA mismatch repair protein MSH5